jgi:HJR/Mrr/RecB family endonuclease
VAAFLDEAGVATGRKKVLYREEHPRRLVDVVPSIVAVNDELIRQLAKHPKLMFELTSRRFEELIAALLEDHGFDVELTPATRDGGKDILARLGSSITSLLVFVECKRYAPTNPVGVEVVRTVMGTQRIYQANKSLIVTTSYFSEPAREEHRLVERQLDLKEYNDVVAWLKRFGQHKHATPDNLP